jgi:hypothetical protein
VDSVPQGGGYPTIWWLPGEVVADTLTLELPPDAPRDLVYRLIVGLYDPDTGDRLPVSGTGADFIELLPIPHNDACALNSVSGSQGSSGSVRVDPCIQP